MLVSAIIITRNRPELLRRAIVSVINQKNNDEIEVIVIDDSSDTNNKLILDEFKNKKIVYYRFEENVGANRCRNKGAEMAKGKFLSYLDDDDEWLESKLQKQLLRVGTKENALIYTGKNILFTKNNKVYKNRYNFSRPAFTNDLKKSIRLFNFIGTTSSILIPKKVFIDLHGFNEKMIALQDYELYIRLIDKGYDVIGIDEKLINYYEFSDKKNISNSLKKNLLSCVQLLKINKGKKYYALFVISVTKIFLFKIAKSIKNVL